MSRSSERDGDQQTPLPRSNRKAVRRRAPDLSIQAVCATKIMSKYDERRSPEQSPSTAGEPRLDEAGSAAVKADTLVATMPPTTSKRYHLFRDLWRGIFLGAYAVDEMHTPGLLAWIIVGFVPGLGTLAAVRDAYYSIEVRSWGALLFNLIGLLPFMKGFANIAQVSLLHRIHRVHRVAHTAHQVAHVARHGRKLRFGSRNAAITGASHEAGAMVILITRKDLPLRNGAAWPAVLLALVSSVGLPLSLALALYSLPGTAYFSNSIKLPFAVISGIVALLWSAVVLLLANYARRTARRLKGRPFSRGVVSAVAFGLAWFTFLAALAMFCAILYVDRGALPAL